MSLFYSLSLEEKISSLSYRLKEEYKLRVTLSKNHKNESVWVIDFSDFGLKLLLTSSSRKVRYDNLIWNAQSNITFELDSSFEKNYIQKQKIIEVLLRVTLLSKGDILFSFNGEELLLYRHQEKLVINIFFDFWNESSKEIFHQKYFIINEMKEIDYFSDNYVDLN